ncbi:MAG: hypothetical protein A3D89_02635 [Planctomycetes bacterium RIFCSPHIGHO2_02_FULL_52_58]|nr:MAG: hypothetical protein A3D89_02635 [Planctomycetes bacterium RIFCSPHIGHO2_02_FULL_52_58]
MLNSSLVLGAGDSKAKTSKEEDEIVEVLDMLEEYELLQDMETLKASPELKQGDEEIEGKNKFNPGEDKKSEKK